MRTNALLALAALLFAGCTDPGLRFEISVPDSLRGEAITGRVFVILTDREPDREPRLTTGGDGATGVPTFGVNVEGLAAGRAAVVDATTFGFPYASLDELPAGEYRVQAIIVPYSEFRRSDGHVIWAHDDRWEGQQPFRSEGTYFSDVTTLAVEPGMARTVSLEATNVVGPAEIPPDTRYVKRVKFRSEMLSAFWGRDIYLGATYHFGPVAGQLNLDATARVKLATADEDRGLGTGANDYYGELTAFETFGNVTPFATVGYRTLGDTAVYQLSNGAYVTGGAHLRVSPRSVISTLINWRQPIVQGGDRSVDATVMFTHDVNANWRLVAYVLKGFTDGSPDLGTGLQLNYHF